MTTALPTYSNAEWDLIHGIMDRIESHLPTVEKASAVDLAKVQSLVLRTYQEQNLPVTAEMISQVCKAMTHTPPAKAVVPQTLLGRKDGPMARAAEAVQRVQNHHPMTTVALMQRIQRPLAEATAKQKKVLRVFFGTLIGVPIALGITLAFSWGVLSTFSAVGAIAGGFLAWVVLLIHIATKDTSLGFHDMAALQQNTAQALVALETNAQSQGHESVEQLLKQVLRFDYSYALLTDHSPEWKEAHRAAAEDRTLRQTWTAWLQSEAPLRQGDVDLLATAAKAIKEAREVMAIYAPTHGLESQASERAKALERLQGEAY